MQNKTIFGAIAVVLALAVGAFAAMATTGTLNGTNKNGGNANHSLVTDPVGAWVTLDGTNLMFKKTYACPTHAGGQITEYSVTKTVLTLGDGSRVDEKKTLLLHNCHETVCYWEFIVEIRNYGPNGQPTSGWLVQNDDTGPRPPFSQ